MAFSHRKTERHFDENIREGGMMAWRITAGANFKNSRATRSSTAARELLSGAHTGIHAEFQRYCSHKQYFSRGRADD